MLGSRALDTVVEIFINVSVLSDKRFSLIAEIIFSGEGLLETKAR